jgi:hypothetical protein
LLLLPLLLPLLLQVKAALSPAGNELPLCSAHALLESSCCFFKYSCCCCL